MAYLSITIERTDEDEALEGGIEALSMVINIGDPDQIDGLLNAFSQIQRAAGYSYEHVGVRFSLIDGKSVEHWSDY